jgi:hypothetical protein
MHQFIAYPRHQAWRPVLPFIRRRSTTTTTTAARQVEPDRTSCLVIKGIALWVPVARLILPYPLLGPPVVPFVKCRLRRVPIHLFTYTRARACIHTHTCAHAHTTTHIHTHTHAHSHTHTHTHTQTHGNQHVRITLHATSNKSGSQHPCHQS